jgi:hypothetical protein
MYNEHSLNMEKIKKQDDILKAEQLKAKRLEAENLKINRLKAEQLREEQLRAEQLREEQFKAESLRKEKLKKILSKIDLYIRSNKKFDGKEPLSYKCAIENVLALFKYDSSALDDICQEDIALKQSIIMACSNKKNFIQFIHLYDWFIIHSDNKISVKKLTPFQGDNSHRVFGYFKCSKCHKNWTSAVSWKDKWQKCKKCEAMIYPYNQRPLEKSEHATDIINKSPHDQLRCEKCVQLGRLCCPSMYY